MPIDAPDYRRLAVRMQALRKASGLTYEQLAEATGLSRRGVIALERGERNGNVGSWFKVAKALGMTMGEFMSVLDR
ncbi:MAG: Transcriptional regulator [Microbacteriaceae bacterium]|nr:Transcriptional regulator [Microbacteriaceae bacterium]